MYSLLEVGVIGHPHGKLVPNGGDAQGEDEGDGGCGNHDSQRIYNDGLISGPMGIAGLPESEYCFLRQSSHGGGTGHDKRDDSKGGMGWDQGGSASGRGALAA